MDFGVRRGRLIQKVFLHGVIKRKHGNGQKNQKNDNMKNFSTVHFAMVNHVFKLH